MTAGEIADALGASETAVKTAIRDMGIEGKRPWNDRRKVVYPDGTLERVRQWLIAHS